MTVELDPGRRADALERVRVLEAEASDLRREAHVKEQQAKSLRTRWQEPVSYSGGHTDPEDRARFGFDDGEFPGPMR